MESLDNAQFQTKENINSKSLLLVEGKDELNFFKALFKALKIKEIQIRNVEGNANFSREIKQLVNNSKFSDVTKLGFVRDAEHNKAKSAFDSICHHLRQNNITPPKNIGKIENIDNRKIGILIMPNNKDEGMLETLCLQSIKNNEICYCKMEEYIECLSEFYKIEKKSFNIDKAKTQVYLASKLPIRNCLGLSALKNQWDFKSPAFNEIKTFLKVLFN